MIQTTQDRTVDAFTARAGAIRQQQDDALARAREEADALLGALPLAVGIRRSLDTPTQWGQTEAA